MRTYFSQEQKREKSDIYISPSGMYTLIINYYDNGKGYWDYTSGTVFNTKELEEKNNNARPNAFITRNYGSFWHCFVQKNEEEYLLCGSDYQGYSVIRCSNGERLDYLYPNSTKHGIGFCWIDCEQVEENIIIVNGCYWGAPFEVVQYDISNIFSLPYPEISRRLEDEDD